MSKKTREEMEAQADEPTESPADAGVTPAEPEDELGTLRRELAELQDKYLRLLAENQNQQKRAQREKQEAVRYAEAEFARNLLIILDDLERTQESARTAQDVPAVAEGVRIVYEHFLKLLKDHGIEQIEAEGRAFDPSEHEALLQQPSTEQPAGTVLQELARGYRMHERVLRPARVIVSGGPAADGPPDAKVEE